MESVNPLDRRAGILRRIDLVDHMNAADDEDTLFELDLAPRFGRQSFHRDLTRCQRAPEGSGQSPGGGGHDVVEGRGVRLDLRRIDFVVDRNLIMDAEAHRLRFSGQPGKAVRAAQPLDADLRDIHDLAHQKPPYPTG
jgi:hypothetical protein